jgi:hypothetical protein
VLRLGCGLLLPVLASRGQLMLQELLRLFPAALAAAVRQNLHRPYETHV